MTRALVLLLVFLFPAVVFSQAGNFWTRFSGPHGGDLRSISQTNAGTLYAHPIHDYGAGALERFGTRLYRSTDQGQNWTLLELTLNGQAFNSPVTIGPSGKFYTHRYHGTTAISSIYRSSDEGASWTLLTDSTNFQSVYETPGGALVALSSTYKILRSTDEGQSWTMVLDGTQPWSGALQIMPNNDLVWFPNTSANQIYHSTNDGQTWSLVTITGGYATTFTMTAQGTMLARSVNTGKVLRSTNKGQSWQEVTLAPGHVLLYLAALPSGRIIGRSVSNQLFFYSDDDGVSWVSQFSDHAINKLFPTVSAGGALFGTHLSALYRSTDGGLSWQFASQGIQLALVSRLAFVSADTFFAVTYNGLWRTFDGGQNWSQRTPGPIVPMFTGMAYGGGDALVVMQNESLLFSSDLGTTFQDITPGNFYKDFVQYRAADALIFTNTFYGLLRSADNGQTWQPSSPESNNKVAALEFHPSGRIFASFNTTADPNFWYSDDAGLSWQPVPGSWGADSFVHTVFIGPSGAIYVLCRLQDATVVLGRSVDNGASWTFRTEVAGNSIQHFSAEFGENAAGHVFLTQGATIYRSLDQGFTWSALPRLADAFMASFPYVAVRNPVAPDQYYYHSASDGGMFRTKNPTTQGAYLVGSVRHDADSDCSTPDAQTPLQNWAVEAAGPNTYWAVTDSTGHYLMFVDTGTYVLEAHTPNSIWWEICEPPQTVAADSLNGLDTIDFSASALSECPLMTVDLTVPLLRRCFNSTIYVHYCNQGAEQADGAWVDINLDPYTAFVSATLPADDLGNNTYRFQVGNLLPGACGQFNLTVLVDCDSTILGQTHCFTAHAYPDTLCNPVPGWSGAVIQARIECQDTVVQMRLKNAGTAPSQTLEYIIIVDDVVLMNGQQLYDPGEEITLELPANGLTWRIESEQEPGHPFATNDHIALAFAEGCGGFNSLGFITQYPVDEYTPSWDRDCVENTGAYDPNDKQGFPTGYSADHKIRPGQELEYLIRFQNTGTDTAFTVVIRDTLSPWLNPATVRPGASSHPYTWSLSGQGALAFTFNNIMLPDSNVNEPASHGFISFRIEQQQGVPLGAVIFNEADIYFDFNDAVRTNQTWHTTGLPQTVGLKPVPVQYTPSEIQLSPQPAASYAVFRRSDGRAFHGHRLLLTDALGRVRYQSELNGTACRVELKGLDAGLYFYRVETEERSWFGSGNLLVRF